MCYNQDEKQKPSLLAVTVEITGHCGISDETERRLWPLNANVNYGNGVNIGY